MCIWPNSRSSTHYRTLLLMIDHRFILYHNLTPTIDLFFLLSCSQKSLLISIGLLTSLGTEDLYQLLTSDGRPGSSKFQRVLPVGFKPKSELSMCPIQTTPCRLLIRWITARSPHDPRAPSPVESPSSPGLAHAQVALAMDALPLFSSPKRVHGFFVSTTTSTGQISRCR